MAKFAKLVVAATTILAVFIAPAPSPASAVGDSATIVHLMFGIDIATFVAARQALSPGGVDWSSDGCSTPLPAGLGDTGRSYNFRAACWRHDFGYRNYKALDRQPGQRGRWWNGSSRKQLDDVFLADMRADCAPRSWTQRSTCRAWAMTYYRAVRVAGGP